MDLLEEGGKEASVVSRLQHLSIVYVTAAKMNAITQNNGL
jgi:hypothetical protein